MQHVTGTTNARRGATPACAWPQAVRCTAARA
ncbi:hypothetical protein BCCR75502_03610 [Burkholderia sola]|nr:hypothetical protein BCCR75389_03594 [Burkholderia cenocepacia]CAG2311121.1 hypothetical protein BCCR75384_03610 [Burkholderia cenocepacia]CAG2311183.1 hypothetical protein BCCR75386_03611 [Burkholderia cenocepacia]CAG2311212.1 hypothetical protein BCCR12632_03613 [Burkholderia cenocepacia]CAG2311214.1 hypothetical protein BCCR75388_03612 [Burkholderia cenocepacia]